MHVCCVSVSVDYGYGCVIIFDYLIRYSTQPSKTLFHMSMFTYLLTELCTLYIYILYCFMDEYHVLLFLFYSSHSICYIRAQYTDIRHLFSVLSFCSFHFLLCQSRFYQIRIYLRWKLSIRHPLSLNSSRTDWGWVSVHECLLLHTNRCFGHTPHHFICIQLLVSRTWNSKQALDFVFWIVWYVPNSEWNINVHTFNIQSMVESWNANCILHTIYNLHIQSVSVLQIWKSRFRTGNENGKRRKFGTFYAWVWA